MPCLLRLLEPALCTLLFSLRYAHRVRTVHVANLRHILLLVSRLAAVFCAFAAVGAALAAFLADETTAQNCQAGSQASAILLLGCLLHGRRSLLVAHLLLRGIILSLRGAILSLRRSVSLTLRRAVIGLLGLLGVVVGHVGCALGRSDCSQWSRVECR